ncbi:MAG: UvrD-helicase domain-containing protein, partial [Pseudomonadota bacterium]
MKRAENFQYLELLNSQQREAVEWGNGPILILAGAGSGKTRVLTYRIAHLIFGHGVSPFQIFAVTFTNKAAAEMRHRVFQLLERYGSISLNENDIWVSTFHSACVRILRQHSTRLGYNSQFTIYDDVDQRSV